MPIKVIIGSPHSTRPIYLKKLHLYHPNLYPCSTYLALLYYQAIRKRAEIISLNPCRPFELQNLDLVTCLTMEAISQTTTAVAISVDSAPKHKRVLETLSNIDSLIFLYKYWE
jgi:hypothetical protein